jgi:hypothetical protein
MKYEDKHDHWVGINAIGSGTGVFQKTSFRLKAKENYEKLRITDSLAEIRTGIPHNTAVINVFHTWNCMLHQTSTVKNNLIIVLTY